MGMAAFHKKNTQQIWLHLWNERELAPKKQSCLPHHGLFEHPGWATKIFAAWLQPTSGSVFLFFFFFQGPSKSLSVIMSKKKYIVRTHGGAY